MSGFRNALLGFGLLASLSSCTVDQGEIAADARADNDRGVALMGQYEYTSAEQVFADVVAREPGWLDARVNHAIATLNRQDDGDERLALDILARVLADDPDHARALYTSAILHLYLGEAEPAGAALERVATIDPQDAYAAYFLGQSRLQAGDYAGAAEGFLASIELDPYLRSAYWAGSQALRRVGRNDEATRLLADYQRFESNPAARLAGFSYARMGPKAHALAASPNMSAASPKPQGALFGEPLRIAEWNAGPATISSVDIDHDGDQDLVATAGDAPRVFLGDSAGAFVPAPEHPLSTANGARAALWGDIDDDGLVDVVLCANDGAHYWRQTGPGAWEAAATLGQPCAAGALADADHDGDLDVFVTGVAGFELFNNNRDGSFRRLAAERGLEGAAGRQLVVADLDSDRDLDILVVNDEPPHDVWENDLTWAYEPLSGLDDLRNTPLRAVTVFDADADGHREIYGVGTDGLRRWRYDGVAWSTSPIGLDLPSNAAVLEGADFDGDQRPDLLVAGEDGASIVAADMGSVLASVPIADLSTAATVGLQPGAGPAVVAVSDQVTVIPPGPGRYPFLALTLTGRSEAEQMRSNGSGIGTLAKVRANGRWTVFDTVDTNSGPGQSLSPLLVGLGGHHQADFIALDWSDGVTQTELDLAAGEHHVIEETQRQLASCPVLFAWNGSEFAFVSDVLGGAALGYLDSVAEGGGEGSYAPPRPVESYLLAGDALLARDGRYQLKLAEPMEENVYLDAARLTVFDLSPGWDMVLDERLAIGGAPATGEPIYFRRALSPIRVVNGSDTDVTALALAKDRAAPPPGDLDHRFVGLLAEDQRLTLEFDAPLPDHAVLVADGWIEYPYSQTVFAAWQAGLRYRPPDLEARGADGAWHTVQEAFGYPAGMPRTMAFRLPQLPEGANALRITSNMEIYWDRLRVVEAEMPDDVRVVELAPEVATVARTGFAKRTTGAQRLPHYDYANRSTYWDAKVPRGFYTALGDAMELASDVDGALAVFGSGEEIHLEFPAVPEVPGGGKRYYAARFHGWAKDMDPYTGDGQTVGPLPVPDDASEDQLARRDALHDRYNVRFEAGSAD